MSTGIYEELIGRLEEKIPSLADQIREEVARGRPVQGSKLPEIERLERQARLQEARLTRIGNEDMAVLPYTGDERLELLCQALLTAARTMEESRRALFTLVIEHQIPDIRIRFLEPNETRATAVELDLPSELRTGEQVLGEAIDQLGMVLREFGVR